MHEWREYAVTRLRALFSTFPSRASSFAVESLFPSLRPLVSHSLRYLCTLRSRTHVVVRMHTRAYIRRVLRKLAPYVSIQISHVCIYSDLSIRLSLAVLLLPSIHSSPRRFRPLQSNGFLSLSYAMSSLTLGNADATSRSLSNKERRKKNAFSSAHIC